MKKKQARKLKSGDKLVMVRDGGYNAAFKAGDRVIFARNKNSQMINVLGLWEGSEIDQTISRKDVELYKPTPCEALGYKVGDLFETSVKCTTFSAGSIVELCQDDGSALPSFSLVRGSSWDGDRYNYAYLYAIKPHTERPHEALRATYKPGQEWEFKGSQSPDWKDCGEGPSWFAQNEYRLKPETTKPQTRREQLIEAGVPAEELAKVVCKSLDKLAESCALISLQNAFVWIAAPQGQNYWTAWYYRLNGEDVTIPEPLYAAPELYCVVFGDDNRMCSINGSVTITAGTLD